MKIECIKEKLESELKELSKDETETETNEI